MQTRCLIDGVWTAADSGRTFPVHDPATDEVIAEVPDMGAAETGRASAAAEKAWPAWRARPAHERGDLIAALGQAMLRDEARLASILTTEQGKPLAEAAGEIRYAASFLKHASGEAVRVGGEIIPASVSEKRILVLRQPVGVAAIITPWNFPAGMITRKLGPALAAGCPVVIKPAEDTPLTALAIAELCVEVGIPPGVVNVVTGDAKTIGEAMLSDVRVRKLSFTGSTEVGRVLMRGAAENLLRLSLELGGHAPFIVFEDADLDRAAAAGAACKLRNAGQTCICANRFLVHESVHDAFVERLVGHMRSMKAGRGTTQGVNIGPLISDEGLRKVEEHVADAVAHGGKVVLGGSRVRLDGLADRFHAPTVITGMTKAMRLWREETFGPVAPVATFGSEEEAVRMANDSEYGLAAYFFTRDAARLVRVAEALEYGIVGANDAAPSTAQAPFGGMKHSGLGREGGRWGVEEYCEIKYVSLGV
jgi:succinate-semialdehyde dehydrogenase / glutarate-semialdehyde dehydrogenase